MRPRTAFPDAALYDPSGKARSHRAAWNSLCDEPARSERHTVRMASGRAFRPSGDFRRSCARGTFGDLPDYGSRCRFRYAAAPPFLVLNFRSRSAFFVMPKRNKKKPGVATGLSLGGNAQGGQRYRYRMPSHNPSSLTGPSTSSVDRPGRPVLRTPRRRGRRRARCRSRPRTSILRRS